MQMMKFDCPPDLAQRFWVMCRMRKMTSGEMLRIVMTHELQEWEMQNNHCPETKAKKEG